MDALDSTLHTRTRNVVQSDTVSLIEVANVLLRRRRMVAALPAVILAATVVAVMLQPREYTATASFMPQQSESLTRGLTGLASQLGLPLPAGLQGDSPALYTELIGSRAILVPMLETEYTVPRGSEVVTGTLVELLDIKGPTVAYRREEALGAVRQIVRVNTSRTTDIVHLSVTARSPALAEQIAMRILELINEFNLETRQSQAREERRFVESRLEESRRTLSSAEDSLQRFLQRNREFRSSPELMLAHGQIEREVLMRQQLYATLSQSYEQARIAEVRDIPVITVIETVEQPVRPNSRGLIIRGIVALVGGLMVAIVLAFVFDFVRNDQGRMSDDVQEFERLRSQAVEDLVKPLRRLRGSRARIASDQSPNARDSVANTVEHHEGT